MSGDRSYLNCNGLSLTQHSVHFIFKALNLSMQLHQGQLSIPVASTVFSAFKKRKRICNYLLFSLIILLIIFVVNQLFTQK